MIISTILEGLVKAAAWTLLEGTKQRPRTARWLRAERASRALRLRPRLTTARKGGGNEEDGDKNSSIDRKMGNIYHFRLH